MDKKRKSICIVTCMKNEGPFILEWIAHNIAVGVSEFLIFSNDCDDGTDAILDRLDDLGIVRHLPNHSLAIDSSQHHRSALAYAPFHKEFLRSDYVMIIDCDEFFVSRVGDGSIHALLEATDYPDVISLAELIFGFGGVLKFQDSLVTEQFKQARSLTPGERKSRRGVKSIMRVFDGIRAYSNHRPAIEKKAIDTIRWLDGSGQVVDKDFIVNGDRGFDARGKYDLARINHYTLRSGESMLAKYQRGDAVRSDRLNLSYIRKRNGHEANIDDFSPHMPVLKNSLKSLMADNKLKKLHAASVSAHQKKISALKSNPSFSDIWKSIQATIVEKG